MNLNELADKVNENMPKKYQGRYDHLEMTNIVSTVLGTITQTTKRGEDVCIRNFGTFTKQRRAARIGVNPSTGERIKIKAKRVLKFRPAKALNAQM